MQPMTLQEVFDNALFGIRQQGYKRSITEGGCAYDSEAGHCGIGHSFAKAGIDGGLLDRVLTCPGIQSLLGNHRFEETAKEEDVKAADAELSKVAILFHGLETEALVELQTIHDDLLGDRGDGRDFEHAMRDYAAGYALIYAAA